MTIFLAVLLAAAEGSPRTAPPGEHVAVSKQDQEIEEVATQFYLPIISYFRRATPSLDDRRFSRVLAAGVLVAAEDGDEKWEAPFLAFTLEDAKVRVAVRHEPSDKEVAAIEAAGGWVRLLRSHDTLEPVVAIMVFEDRDWREKYCQSADGVPSCQFSSELAKELVRQRLDRVSGLKAELVFAVDVQPR